MDVHFRTVNRTAHQGYLNRYDITKYQWPDPFDSVESARITLQEFLNEMDREETLFFSILTNNGEFLGSVEIHGLVGDCPELGVWVVKTRQNLGYASEALSAVLDYVSVNYNKTTFYYEADVRNIGSIKLLHKLESKYKIIDHDSERLTTGSGKKLELQGHTLMARG